MTLTKKEKLTVLQLIESLPLMVGRFEEGHRLIPWYELEDRLQGMHPKDIESCVKKQGGFVEFGGVGMRVVGLKL